jgi:hypothetical protein
MSQWGWFARRSASPSEIEPNRKDYVPGSVRYGSQANVIVYATDNAVVNAIGALWIRLVAILTYVS